MNKQAQPGVLSGAAAAAVALLAGLSDAERHAALRAAGFAEPRRIWTPRVIGALPVLTELIQERNRDAIYASPLWAARYRRGQAVIVYVLQAPGLAQFAAALGGTSVAKVGSSTAATIDSRIARLGREGYGAWYRKGRSYQRDDGFEAFHTVPRLQLARQHPASPIALCSYGVEVALSQTMTAGEFEAALNWRLGALRLQAIADTAAGRALCARTGVALTSLRRFYKNATSYKSATELTMFRPQADIGALARMCEDIVIDEVLGQASKRPVR